MTKHRAIFLMLGMGATGFTSQSYSQALERGQMLYENHCLECHESQVHIRKQSKVRSLKNLEEQVNRWEQELKLTWRDGEVGDVARYLNHTFYKFEGDE